jgi:hypothetical protein
LPATRPPAPAEADRLRRELAEHDPDPGKAEEASAGFVGLCEKFGVERLVADLVLGQLARFSSYTFCRSHAVSYAMVAWQECHSKANHPLAFWVGALNNHHGVYPIRVYIEAAKRAGLSVWLPCVNRSLVTFTQEVTGIRTGLGAVRGLDRSSAVAVVEQRQHGGPFQGLADFRQRAGIPPPDVELLIRAGCLDFTGQSRQALLREAEAGQRMTRPPAWWAGRERKGVEPWPLEGLPAEYTLRDQWKEEWSLLAFLCGPPLMALLRACVPPELPDSRSLLAHAGHRVRLAGLLAPARGDPPADEQTEFTVEEEWGLVEVCGAEAASSPESLGPAVVVEGKVEERYGVAVVTDARLERLLPGASFSLVARSPVEPPRSGAVPQRNGAARPA